MSKRQPFLVPGIVAPEEYNWRKQFAATARAARRDYEPFRPLDIGKVMGIVEAYSDALEMISELKRELSEKTGDSGEVSNNR
jgi:hypothetical protein